MKKLILSILYIMNFTMVVAQNCSEGYAEFRNSNFKAAQNNFQKCLKASPNDSSLLYMNGLSLVKMKKYEKAKPFLKQAIEGDVQNMASAKFNLGLCVLQDGKNDEALVLMQEAADLGFRRYTDMQTGEYAWVEDSEKFKSIKKQVYENAFPCLKDSNNSKFDFWLGEWDVYVNEKKTAESRITKAMGGCAVHEDYVTSSGYYAGQSISYYDPADKIWNQYWVGSAGDKSKYYETSDYDANLQFMTKRDNPNGIGEIWTRMSYLQENKDTVIQLLDSSTDEGATWTQAFKGSYKRK